MIAQKWVRHKFGGQMEEFKIEVPIFAWQGKPLLRVSIQAYNSRADVDRLVEALERILGRG